MQMPPTPETDAQALLRSGLFLRDWYAATHAAALTPGRDPLSDFCATGWRAGRSPNPYFDCDGYVASNPDVGRSGINPLLHYLRWGDREGRRPISFFDPAWYRAAHGVRDDETTLAHFLARCCTGTVRPVAEFAPLRHMRLHPHIDWPNRDPFLHSRQTEPPLERDVLAASGLFDASYYLGVYPDIRDARLDPLEHFCKDGWREGRAPNMYFHTSRYCETMPQSAAGTNPLLYYYLEGELRGTFPSPWFDPAWYCRAYAIPPWRSALAHYLSHRRGQAHSPNPGFDLAAHLRDHGEEIGPNRDPFAHRLLGQTRRA